MQGILTIGYEEYLFASIKDAATVLELLGEAKIVKTKYVGSTRRFFEGRQDIKLRVDDVPTLEAKDVYEALESYEHEERMSNYARQKEEREANEAAAREKEIQDAIEAALAAKEAEAVLTANPQYGDPSAEELKGEPPVVRAPDPQLIKEVGAYTGPYDGLGEPCEGRR